MTCYKVVMTCHWTSLVKIKCWICLFLRPALIIYMFVVLRPKFFIVGSSFFFNFLDNPIIKIFFHILRKINKFHIIDTKTQSKWVFNMICTINFFLKIKFKMLKNYWVRAMGQTNQFLILTYLSNILFYLDRSMNYQHPIYHALEVDILNHIVSFLPNLTHYIFFHVCITHPHFL